MVLDVSALVRADGTWQAAELETLALDAHAMSKIPEDGTNAEDARLGTRYDIVATVLEMSIALDHLSFPQLRPRAGPVRSHSCGYLTTARRTRTQP